MRRFLVLGLLGLITLFPMTSVRALVIAEPIGDASTALNFPPRAVALPAHERAKLANFVQRLLHRFSTPVHECDIDVFLFLGERGGGTPAELKIQDEMFDKRVSYLREILQRHGISKRVGHLIHPSEASVGSSVDPDSVEIEAKYWIHGMDEEVAPDHVECKWPLPPWQDRERRP